MQESIEASIVRIHTADGHIVGAGFLVGERHILTCAHVISKALELASFPVDPPPGVISLDFPRISPRTFLAAKIVLWCPPSTDGSGDLAGLELERDPPTGAERVRFASVEDVWKHDFSTLGFPEDFDEGVWATGRLLRRQASNWIQIEDMKAQGFAVGPGFSGAPVWDEQLQGVVGMVVASSHPVDTRTAFVIPLEMLAAAWPLLTVPQGQPRNPYKGLRSFTQHDAGDFFGREAVVEKVVDLVNSLVTDHPASSSTRMLTILGPSGVGKSSLVMAGLLPKLQQGVLPGSKEWVYLDPLLLGKHPLEALASKLKPHFPDTSFKTLREDLGDETARGLHLLAMQLAKQRGTSVVILIDQFEELFTQTESEDERQRFIRLLLKACSEPRGAVVVLLTLRADFYDRPMQYPGLFRLIEAQHLSLLAIEPDDLRRVVEQPAALPDVQVTFEGDLVNRLLFEVQGQIGALPLLQFTLDQLFQRRSGRQLTLAAYREMGGVKGALTRQAEETYAALPSEEHRKLARALFVRLIDPGASEQDTTRRRAALSEFSLPDASQTRLLQETIDAFIAARLLTTNEIAGTTTIEVSHEALIREWTRLADWLREAREDIRLQQVLSEDAAEWIRRDKPVDRLYQGTELAEAQIWMKRNSPSRDETNFLQASITRERRERFQRRFLIGITSAVLVGMLLVALVLQGNLLTAQRNLLASLPVSVTNLNDHGPGSLRDAISRASDGEAITFANTLKGGTITLTSGELTINKDLTISGTGESSLSISGGDRSRVFHISPGVSVTISNVTIKEGHPPDDRLGMLNEGAGILNEGALVLINSVIAGNKTSSIGGGIMNMGDVALATETSSQTVRCTNNGQCSRQNSHSATIVDKGIVGGTLTLIDSIVSGNIAQQGGGIENEAGTLNITESTVSHNTAYNQNGVIFGFKAGQGGGIFNLGILTLTDSTVSNNTADDAGGGIVNTEQLTITRSTVSDNRANDDGGGILDSGTFPSSQLVITNSTITSNRAKVGGGGIATGGDKKVSIAFCTIYDNAAQVGGGIFNTDILPLAHTKEQSNVSLLASIVAGDNADRSPDVLGALTLLYPNLIQNVSGAPILFGTDPLDPASHELAKRSIFGKSPHVGPLGNNGGLTQTYALLPGSPAIDQIPATSDPAVMICHSQICSTDQRGMKRPDGNEPFCDIGAYEYVDSA